MAKQSDNVNPLDPFGVWSGMRDANFDAWSKAMIDLVNTEAYSKALGMSLESYLVTSAPFQQVMEKVMTQVLERLNMPTRSDIISLAERMTNIEMRLDDMDAKFDALERRIPRTPASASK